MSLVTRLTENNESSLALFPVPMPSERTIYFSLTLESKTSKLSPEYSPLDEAEKLFISTVNFGISVVLSVAVSLISDYIHRVERAHQATAVYKNQL